MIPLSDHNTGITKDEALHRLRAAARDGDTESAHADADDALIAYINDPEIQAAYDDVDKWYA